MTHPLRQARNILEKGSHDFVNADIHDIWIVSHVSNQYYGDDVSGDAVRLKMYLGSGTCCSAVTKGLGSQRWEYVRVFQSTPLKLSNNRRNHVQENSLSRLELFRSFPGIDLSEQYSFSDQAPCGRARRLSSKNQSVWLTVVS